jgi:hypothetical protein
MAAEVVVPFGRPVDEERELNRAERRHTRRRISFVGKFGVATTPREKLEAALDYFRSVTADTRVNPVKAGIATEHLADQLIASADQLAKTVGRKR